MSATDSTSKRPLIALSLLVALTSTGAILVWRSSEQPNEAYDPEASIFEIDRWRGEYVRRKDWLTQPLAEGLSDGPIEGDYLFSRYNYRIRVKRDGQVLFLQADGLDRQVGGGAWWAVGAGRLEGNRARISWDCVDLSRSFANGGGALLTFEGDRLEALYYHDTQPSLLEWGEGRRVKPGVPDPAAGTYRGRVPKRVSPATREGGFRFEGRVVGPEGAPIADARVQIKGIERSATLTDSRGRFALHVPGFGGVLRFTAGKAGWRNGQTAVYGRIDSPEDLVQIVLEPASLGDHAGYEWISPDPIEDPDDVRELFACGNCHRRQWKAWNRSRHSLAAVNPHFIRAYQWDFLPALKAGEASIEEAAAACAACHVPSAWARREDSSSDPILNVDGVDERGNHCDFCHKIRHIEEADRNGLSGSLVLGRPEPSRSDVPGPVQQVFGPLTDATYQFMGASFSPIFRTSWLCAGCHESDTNESGLKKLETFSEWRDVVGVLSDPRSCQDCHMPGDVDLAEDEAAIWAMDRGPDQLKDHQFRGADAEQLRTALRFSATAQAEGEQVSVSVEIENVGADHKVPTGSSNKHLVLVVIPFDLQGRPMVIQPSVGSVLPESAGLSEEPLQERLRRGLFAGLGGALWDRRLAVDESSDPVPWWRATRELWDRRLAPKRPSETRITYHDSDHVIASFEVRLIHRRAWPSEWPLLGLDGRTGPDPGGRDVDLEIVRHTVPVAR